MFKKVFDERSNLLHTAPMNKALPNDSTVRTQPFYQYGGRVCEWQHTIYRGQKHIGYVRRVDGMWFPCNTRSVRVKGSGSHATAELAVAELCK